MPDRDDLRAGDLRRRAAPAHRRDGSANTSTRGTVPPEIYRMVGTYLACTHKENKDKGTSSTMITKVLMDVNPKWEKYVVEFQVRASRRISGSNLRLISDTPLTFVQMCLRVAGQRHCPLTALTPHIRTVRHLSRWSRSRLGHVAPPSLPVLHLEDDTWHALLTYYPW